MAMSNAGAVRMRVKIHAERSLDNSDAHCKTIKHEEWSSIEVILLATHLTRRFDGRAYCYIG